jgi:hypothetical protein
MGRNRTLGSPLEIQYLTSSLATSEPHIDVYAVEAPLGSPVALTLDASPFSGDQLLVVDVGLNAATQPIGIKANAGQNILGFGSAFLITTNGGSVLLTYSQALSAWIPVIGGGGAAAAQQYVSGFAAGPVGPLTTTEAPIVATSASVTIAAGQSALVWTSVEYDGGAGNGSSSTVTQEIVDQLANVYDSVDQSIFADSAENVARSIVATPSTPGTYTFSIDASVAALVNPAVTAFDASIIVTVVPTPT